MPLLRKPLLYLLLMLWQLHNLHAQVADELDEERPPFVAGLLVGSETSNWRLAGQIFQPEVSTDQGLSWRGFLESDADGEYLIAAVFVGELHIQLNDQTIIRAVSEEPSWISSEPIQLEYAHHQIRVTLRPTTGGRMSLTTFWKGPGFRFEPIPPKYLWHESASKYVMDSRGAELVRALRCEACHTLPNTQREPLRSPDLTHAGQYLRPEWLNQFFLKNAAERVTKNAALSLVHAAFDRQEAADIVAWLRSSTNTTTTSSVEVSSGDSAAGKTLMLTNGCIACHSYEDVGESTIFGGGDLSDVASKRPAYFFRKWLADPASVNSNHRMPQFSWDDEELTDLSAFLASTRTSPVPQQPLESGNAVRGRELAASHRCGECHTSNANSERTVISAASDWSNACTVTSSRGRPRYILHEEDQLTIAGFVGRMPTSRTSDGALLLMENSCLQCHARGDSHGLAPINDKVAVAHSDLVDRLPAMRPPALDGVGDKFHDRVLRGSISREEKRHRPWLSVQMPKFPLSDDHIDRIAQFFVAQDRVPDSTDQPMSVVDDEDKSMAARMVTSDGFGCTSCHAIGKVQPSAKTPVSQLAPSLSMPKHRIRKVWFDRWVRDPARITAKMEMPSVRIPIPRIMDGDLDRQLDAVWAILNTRQFSPPDASPTRIVRRTGRPGDRAAVLTDIVLFNGEKLIKPFLIGLPNRHNVLLDLQQCRLVSWWTGDTARQRTQGKTWFWESSLLNLPKTNRVPEIVLVRDGVIVEPQRIGQFVAEPDEWSHIAHGVELKHRLFFPLVNAGASEPQLTQVTQRFTATKYGWKREIRVVGLGDNESIGVRPSFETSASSARYRDRADLMTSRGDVEGRAEMTLEYRSAEKNVATAATGDEAMPRARIRKLGVMPGFHATQLPVRSDVMPISLGWRPNGELLIGSLKGRVWSVKDTDRDGLEDHMRRVSDDLAAPYGICATNEFVDVATKYGVVRCHDADKDGVAERHELVASGWGHTDDYHDWVVGLPKDEAGNYFLSVPCQQDERSEAAAHLRGRVLKLTPRDPTVENPRRYELKEVSGGHRFPMGIARNTVGQLFVTDNQGNYNPFNELNHVIQGSRYGFINRVEQSDDFRPPLTTPAIDIPHPWTRSVNGICFLETPESLVSQGEMFGPFEGQLVGCEYDTRRLIRMSLEEVNGRLQGAAYPFAEAATDPEDGFQGPINCGIAPSGALYVANIRDSGWGGANNTGSLVRILPDLENLPPGIAEVCALASGFRIRFTRPLDAGMASRIDSYQLSSYRRISTPSYGGDDVDRRQESVLAAVVAEDGMSVDLTVADLRPGFVYDFHLKKMKVRNARAATEDFYPAEAFYTLRSVPR